MPPTRLRLIYCTSSCSQNLLLTAVDGEIGGSVHVCTCPILNISHILVHCTGPISLPPPSVLQHVGTSCEGLPGYSLPKLVYPQDLRRHRRTRCSSKRSAEKKREKKKSVLELSQTSHEMAAQLRFLCSGKILCIWGENRSTSAFHFRLPGPSFFEPEHCLSSYPSAIKR